MCIMNTFIVIVLLNVFGFTTGDITRQVDIELPGRERISKRSLPTHTKTSVLRPHLNTRSRLQRSSQDNTFYPNGEDLGAAEINNSAEDQQVGSTEDLKTKNDYRRTRSLSDNNNQREDILEDIELADNINVMRPVVIRRTARSAEVDEEDRQRRSNGDESIEELEAVGKRRIRAVEQSSETKEDLETAANMVFRPIFHHRRFGRSAEYPEEGEEILETAENIVFRPHFKHNRGFNRRFRRNAQENKEVSAETNEDLETAANMVFRPIFHHRRFGRSAENPEEGEETLETAENIVFRPHFKHSRGFNRRFRRNVQENKEVSAESNEDLETAANMVFRPIFHHRRFGRSAENPEEDEEILATAENIVFRPHFKHNRGFNRRFRRDTQVNQEVNAETNEDLETAANMVFRPIFHHRRFGRSAEYPEEGEEILETAENIVFRPHFKHYRGFNRRFRRDTQINQEVNAETNEDLETAANMVFRPIFHHRRFGRSAENPEDNEELLVTAENIVFRPHFRHNRGFNRRVRREVSSPKSEIDNPEIMKTAENSVVFRPHFKKHHRHHFFSSFR